MAKTMLKSAGTTLTDIIVNKILGLRKKLLAPQADKKPTKPTTTVNFVSLLAGVGRTSST